MIKVHEFGSNTSASAMEDFIKKEEIGQFDIISFTRFFDSNKNIEVSTLMYFKADEPEEDGNGTVVVEVPDSISIT